MCGSCTLFFCVYVCRSLAWFLPCPLHSAARRCGIMLIPFETKIIILNNVKGHVHANPPRNYRRRANIRQTAVPCERVWARVEQRRTVNFRFLTFFLSIQPGIEIVLIFFPRWFLRSRCFVVKNATKESDLNTKNNNNNSKTRNVSVVLSWIVFYIKIWM